MYMAPGYDNKVWCKRCIKKLREEHQRASARISYLKALTKTLTAQLSRHYGEGPSALYHGGQLLLVDMVRRPGGLGYRGGVLTMQNTRRYNLTVYLGTGRRVYCWLGL